MKKTRHMEQRMRRRGIREWQLLLVIEFGVPQPSFPERLILNRRCLRALYEDGQISRKDYLAIERQVPLVCVLVEELGISAWRPKPSVIDRPGKRVPHYRGRLDESESEGLEEAA